MSDLYQQYIALSQKINDISNSIAVLSWDHEVYMPIGGAHYRAQQISTLSGIYHDLSTSSEFIDVVEKLKEANGLDFRQRKNIIESVRSLEKARKLSKAFIEKESKTHSQAYQNWVKAKQENNYSLFAPKLKEVIELQREKAQLWGYKEHPYDALLDKYEPYLTTSHVEKVFNEVKTHLATFLDKIKGQQQPDQSFFENHFDKDKQLALCRKLISDLGYDWNAGRFDVSVHPFTTSFNTKDVRITTRANENDIRESIWGSIHETGHAFYEMGLPEEDYGLPSSSPVSLGIHESQSRLWENNVGKSYNYIKGYLPLFQQFFPDAFGNVTDMDFFKGLNTVKPTLVRINSDEVTYHLHILLRFEIEKGLIEGSINVNDLEEVWNSYIKKYLGLDVPSPKMGILQDIHWSHGSFGYFPTYSLGSFYAAQFYHFANKAIPNLEEQILQKNFGPLLHWLRKNIHEPGGVYTSEELCTEATGEGLNFKYFNNYLDKKYSDIYQL